MLHPVWLGLYFWYYLGHLSSVGWLISIQEMHFLKKTTGMVANILLRETIIFSWLAVNVLLYKNFKFLRANRGVNRFFRRYERFGKIVGWVILSFIGIVLHNFHFEKSIPCMFSFLFLALNCLCTRFCIQPYTDFGVFEFLLGESLDQAFNHFGIHSCYSWVVLIACIVMFGLYYGPQPEKTSLLQSLEEIVIDPSPSPNNLSSVDETLLQQAVQPRNLPSLETEEIEIQQNEQPPIPNNLPSLQTEEIEIQQNEQPPSLDNLPFLELKHPFKPRSGSLIPKRGQIKMKLVEGMEKFINGKLM